MDITYLGSGLVEIDEHLSIADTNLFDWVIGTHGEEVAGTFDTRFTQQGPTVRWAFTI